MFTADCSQSPNRRLTADKGPLIPGTLKSTIDRQTLGRLAEILGPKDMNFIGEAPSGRPALLTHYCEESIVPFMSRQNLLKFPFAGLVAVSAVVAGCGGSSPTLESVRTSFVGAGGECASEEITTPTTDPASDTGPWSAVGKQSISCGEDQVTISEYDSPADAQRAAFFSEAMKSGLFISVAGEPLESTTILLDRFTISPFTDSTTGGDVDEISKKMKAEVFYGLDFAARKEKFTKYVETAPDGVMNTVAEGCISKKLISSDGSSISFDTKGNDDTEGDLSAQVFCVLRALMAPDYIAKSVMETRALDGQVEETWDGFKVSWRYHPDTGLQLTVIKQG